MAARTGVLLLTGGPGTGKTTSTRGIVALFEGMGLQVLLLALRKPIEKAEGTEADKRKEETGV